MKLLMTSVAALTLLSVPVLAQSEDVSPSPNQRALQKPQSSDPATTVPDSSTEGASPGEEGAGPAEDPNEPAYAHPDDAEPRVTDPARPMDRD